MARQQHAWTWRVTWRGSFPLDMLRYDQCWPVDTCDANAIRTSLETPNNKTWTAQVRTRSESKIMAPITTGRWESFGCQTSEARTTP